MKRLYTRFLRKLDRWIDVCFTGHCGKTGHCVDLNNRGDR